MQVTRARVFDDFGGAALGNWGRRAVYVTVYATILAEPIIFHLTSMEAPAADLLQRRAYTEVCGPPSDSRHGASCSGQSC